MKILIELPSWLGDTVMATPAIENLINNFNDASFTLVGSMVAIEAIKDHPRVAGTYVLSNSYISLFKIPKELGRFDIFFSFRGSIRAKLLKLIVRSSRKFQFDKGIYNEGHQVEKYNDFINKSINKKFNPGRLVLYSRSKIDKKEKKILGINPGASYGSAKRWYPKEFAEVISALADKYDIIIFGGPEEQKSANEIEQSLKKKGIKNFQNLASMTSIPELISKIKNLDLFITGDSGPMHIAAAFQIPTISIFGPTRIQKTSQWLNNKNMIIKKDMKCRPCMKRTCPLGHHNCMKLIKASDVLEAEEKIA
jgi:heptosyltransferase II